MSNQPSDAGNFKTDKADWSSLLHDPELISSNVKLSGSSYPRVAETRKTTDEREQHCRTTTQMVVQNSQFVSAKPNKMARAREYHHPLHLDGHGRSPIDTPRLGCYDGTLTTRLQRSFE